MTIHSELIDERPDGLMDDMPAGSVHWKVTLRHKGRRMIIYYSQGPAVAGEPKMEDVLGCIARDAADADGYETFEEWCNALGLSEDSRKAERIYKAVSKQAEAFQRLCGGEYVAIRDKALDW